MCYMLGIGSIIVAFIATVVGLTHSHSVPLNEQFLLGQSKLGISLVFLATLALAFGIFKEVETAKSAQQLKEDRVERDEMLRKIYSKISSVKEQSTNDESKQQLELILKRISATASNARESDFSMSDFSHSDFASGNFTKANFENALFRGANLAGADLSGAYIDKNTKLPK